MVVNKVPSPALVVGAEESDVAVALVRCLLCRDPDDGDGAQRPLPNNLPRMTTAGESRLAACPIGALYMICFVVLTFTSKENKSNFRQNP